MSEEREAVRAKLREKLVRELRAGFLETSRSLALQAAINVAETVDELVRLEVLVALDREIRRQRDVVELSVASAEIPACPRVDCDVHCAHFHLSIDGELRMPILVGARS